MIDSDGKALTIYMRFRPAEVRYAANQAEDGVYKLTCVAEAAATLIQRWRTDGIVGVHQIEALETALCLLVGVGPAEAPAPEEG